jgi:hypothetical protein
MSNRRSMLLVGIASTAFVMNDALVKIVSVELPAGEIIVLRGELATGMLSIAAVALRAVRPLRILIAPAMVLRLASSATATTLVVISLRQMPSHAQRHPPVHPLGGDHRGRSGLLRAHRFGPCRRGRGRAHRGCC